jgi:hypothetical protein
MTTQVDVTQAGANVEYTNAEIRVTAIGAYVEYIIGPNYPNIRRPRRAKLIRYIAGIRVWKQV